MKKIYRIWQVRHQETLLHQGRLIYFEQNSTAFPDCLHTAATTISLETASKAF